MKEQFGANIPVYHKIHYNSRAQLCDVRASAVNDEWGGELGALVNYYSTNWSHCGNGPDNNGNVLMSQTIINSYYMEDRYSYDALNRLTAVDEYQNGATHTGSQQYDYDRYGNRLIKAASWGTGINNKQFTRSAVNNRLGVPVGQSGVMSYDAAGNLTNDTYTGAGHRTYDAENKITSAWGGNNQEQLYAYDAGGQRIKRTVDGAETWQVYGFGGELVAEYAANGAATSPQKEYGYRNGQLLINATPGSGLVGHWKADENTGTTTADATGNGSTGTLTSGAGWTTGQSGSAVNFDGVNDYVQVGAHSKLVVSSAASFSAWVYPTGPGSDATHGGTILVKEGEYVIARYPNGTIRWGFANSNPGWAFVDTGHVAPLNQWTHITITYDNGTIKTYANGSLVHTYSGSGAIGDAITGQNDFRIGGRQVISQHFHGRIDEVRVYNRVLTATEIGGLASGPAISVLAVTWLVSDHLGTPRMIIDQTGTLANIKRHDYLPFGEELFAGAGGRTTALGYSGGDGVRQQFTQKERDVETGLDYFGARYYAAKQGRFTGVDPLMASARAASPQSWNRYTYVLNNPLRLIDPTGLSDEDATFTVNNPCEYGTVGCNPVDLATVTVPIPPVQPLPLETTSMTIAENLMLGSGQVLSDTVIGAGKSLYNTLYGTANMVNAPIDYGLSFFTDFQFGQTELYEASTPGEQSAMYGMMIGGLMAGGVGSLRTTAATGEFYSVAYETQLSATAYPGLSRAAHFQKANEALLTAMEGDAAFASTMQQTGVTLQRTITGLAPRTPPVGWTWHHAQAPGVMQLVPRSQHTAGSIFWETLHPGGRGGYSIWGQ